MWQAFGLMHKAFKAGAELYLEGTAAYAPSSDVCDTGLTIDRHVTCP